MTDKNKYKFAILGGDGRQAVIADGLIKMGHRVSCFATDENAMLSYNCELCSCADKAMTGADFTILPLPVSKDGIHLSSNSQMIDLSEIAKLAKKNSSIIFGGIIPENLTKACQDLDVEFFDYYTRESLQVKNALPSAEGALMIAMEHTDITVFGMKALICGYGRIGKILAIILKNLGASVTVAARRDETLCEIAMCGFDAIKIGDGNKLSMDTDYDVIFNTVPSIIFTDKVLKNIKNRPLYIEIASSPGGIDASAARNVGIEIIHAPSLPGRYAPKSAGGYVLETIAEILSERGIGL